MNCCYIIYSTQADRYYIGATHVDVHLRIQKHNDKSYGQHYTSMTDDWTLYFCIDCETYAQALNIERHIKKMKSRTYIENLRKYPEISEKLKLKYNPGSGLSR